jgi:hypothetical protein
MDLASEHTLAISFTRSALTVSNARMLSANFEWMPKGKLH